MLDGAPENESGPVAEGAAEAVGALDALAELDPPSPKNDEGVAPPGGEAEGAGEPLVRPLPETSPGD